MGNLQNLQWSGWVADIRNHIQLLYTFTTVLGSLHEQW